MNQYDAIIVGARCGGAPLAMLLVRAGHKVLLVDRMEIGSDMMSTHYVKRTGAAFGAPLVVMMSKSTPGLLLVPTVPIPLWRNR